MATPQSDGSIVLTTKVVTTGIQKGMTVIKNSIKTATVALTAFGTATGYLVKQSVQAYAEYEQLVGGVETLFKKSADKVMKYASEAYRTSGMSANEYMANVTSFSASLLSSLGGDTDRVADVANAAIISMSDNANKMGTNMESVVMAFQGFAKQQYMLLDNLKLGYGGTKTEMERLLKDAQAITGVKYDINNLADVYTAIGVIQEKLGIAGTTALEAEKTISGSAATMKAAWQNTLAAISGGGDLDSAIESLVVSIENYFNNILPVVEKALFGIGRLVARISPMLVQTVAESLIRALPQLISALWKTVIGLFSGIKSAIAELLSGKPSEIVEKQAEKTKETAKNQAQLTENIKETNKEMKKTLAGFDDIQILSAGATEDVELPSVSVGETQEAPAETATTGADVFGQTDTKFMEMVGKVSKWLMAIGAILLVTGNIGWGLGLIIAGAIGSEYAEAKVGDGSSLAELLETIGTVLTIVGIVAILLGVLLCFASMWGIGIKLIAIGAASTVGAVALNWNAITEQVLQIFTDFAGIIAGLGAALIVLGILLCCTGVGVGLGIGLILAGATAIGGVVAVNWNAIVDWVKGAWDAVKKFWNAHIAPVFTAKFWLNLAKGAANGLIDGFEKAINGIISMFEKMINWVVDGLNKISFDVPKWVPLIGGKKFGFDIPEVKFGRVSIPRLAQGAVIPPNKEFLAVLGDQKQGTNIEAPLQTIVDAFNIALANRGGFGGKTEVVLEIDGREFGRAVVEQGNRENRRIGTRLVIA
jgi:hypothetical protein